MTARYGKGTDSDAPAATVVGTLGTHHGVEAQAAWTGRMIAHTLRSEGADASEDGTGRGTPLVVTPIDLRQASRGATMTNNRPGGSSGGAPGTGIGEPGDPAFTISERGQVVSFNWQSGGDVRQDVRQDVSGALHVGQTPAVLPFDTTQVTSKLNRSVPKPGDPCHPLAAHAHAPAVAFALRGREGGAAAEMGDDAAFALRSSQGGGDKPHVLTAVPRRLTPVECERLQGWPDDWTRYGTLHDGEVIEISDSARYRMAGNGVSKPVAEWIGKRMAEIAPIGGSTDEQR